jgi:hypothetical protein
MVESSAWKELFLYCNPEAKLPGRPAIREEISELFIREFENAKQLLKVRSTNHLNILC